MNYRVVAVGEDICHHGIKGQKWGVRRYQNKDGSLTSAGKKRYSADGTVTEGGKTRKMTEEEQKRFSKITEAIERMNRSSDPYAYALLPKYLQGDSLTDIKYQTNDKYSKIVSIEIEGKRATERVLSKVEQKVMDKAVRDHYVDMGKTAIGAVIGGGLSLLSLSYLQDLGII